MSCIQGICGLCAVNQDFVSISQVSRMTEDQFEILDAATAVAANSNSNDVAHTQTFAPNPNMDP
jgi:hypothetical protein